MTMFSVLLLGLLAALVLAVLLGVWQLRRQAVAQEAMAEVAGSLADVKVSEAEADAALVMAALRDSEREEDTKPDHPKPLHATCSRCGWTTNLCLCPKVI